MSGSGPKQYRFARSVHWQRCLVHRLDPSGDALSAGARLGSVASPVGQAQPASMVAIDPYGRPVWRVDEAGCTGRPALLRHDDVAGLSGPYDIDALLGSSPRWAIDRESLWALSESALRRYDLETLLAARTFPVGELFADPALPNAVLQDVAADTRGGAWVLATAADGGQWLVHVDGKGCRGPRLALPCAAGHVCRVAVVERGHQLVLLAGPLRRLCVLDAGNGRIVRTIGPGDLLPCWNPCGLAGDGMRRLVVWGHEQKQGHPKRWVALVLNAAGDLVEGPLADFALTGAGEADPPTDPVREPAFAAVWRDRLWVAAGNGLWQIGGHADGTGSALEAMGTLLTPGLRSPVTAMARGWLRAEVTVDLPPGAVVEAEFATTDDASLADRLAALAADMSTSASQRQQAIWSLLDHPPGRRFVIADPPGDDVVTIPLFGSSDEWLWLRLALLTPPGSPPQHIRELRVLYPDESIARHLPAIFRGRDHEPGGVLRRLVGVLEATTQRLDERIAALGTLIDPSSAPPEWLDYLARWLALPWDDGLDPAVKREIVRHAGELLEWRATRRGVETLLRALVGPDAPLRLVDLTVDHPAARLGGSGTSVSGAGALPLLLAGVRPGQPLLGRYTVLGRARLCPPSPGDDDPLATLRPTLRVEIGAARSLRKRVEPLLTRVVAQYVPAGLRLAVRWVTPGTLGDEEVLVLGGVGPAALGGDSELGQAVLGGRAAGARTDRVL